MEIGKKERIANAAANTTSDGLQIALPNKVDVGVGLPGNGSSPRVSFQGIGNKQKGLDRRLVSYVSCETAAAVSTLVSDSNSKQIDNENNNPSTSSHSSLGTFVSCRGGSILSEDEKSSNASFHTARQRSMASSRGGSILIISEDETSSNASFHIARQRSIASLSLDKHSLHDIDNASNRIQDDFISCLEEGEEINDGDNLSYQRDLSSHHSSNLYNLSHDEENSFHSCRRFNQQGLRSSLTESTFIHGPLETNDTTTNNNKDSRLNIPLDLVTRGVAEEQNSARKKQLSSPASDRTYPDKIGGKPPSNNKRTQHCWWKPLVFLLVLGLATIAGAWLAVSFSGRHASTDQNITLPSPDTNNNIDYNNGINDTTSNQKSALSMKDTVIVVNGGGESSNSSSTTSTGSDVPAPSAVPSLAPFPQPTRAPNANIMEHADGEPTWSSPSSKPFTDKFRHRGKGNGKY